MQTPARKNKPGLPAAVVFTALLAGPACWPTPAGAIGSDELPVRRYGVEDGLSHNAVHAITQDAYGFIWFGTQDGLDRFDGIAVTHFGATQEADAGMASAFVTAFAPTPDGGVWVGTRRGLHRVDPGHAGVERVLLADQPVQPAIRILLLAGSRLWVATEAGLFIVHLAQAARDIDAPYELDGKDILAMARAPDDTIWIIYRGDPCALANLDVDGRMRSPPIHAPCTNALAVDDQSRFWLDLEGPWEPDDALSPERQERLPWGFEVYRGALLARGLTGVHRRDPASGFISPLWLGRKQGFIEILSGEVLSLLVDRDDALWIGTYDGVFQLDPQAPFFGQLEAHHLPHVQLEDTPVSTIHGSTDGRWLWLGTFGSGLLLLDRENRQWRHWRHDPDDPHSLCSDYIWSIIERPSGAALIDGHCEVRIDGSIAHDTEPPVTSFRSIIADDESVLWMASMDGLYRRSVDGWQHMLDGAYEAVFAGDDGGLWLAAVPDEEIAPGGALRHFNPASGEVRHFHLPVPEYIFDLLPDGPALWIATGAGLLHLEPASGRWQHHLPVDVDAGRVYYSLSRDRSGRLWIGSNRGLLRFDPRREPGRRFRAYDHLDGVINHEFNRRARFQHPSGRIYLGGMSGVTVFDPERVSDSTRAPMPLLTGIHVLGAGGERHLSGLGVAGFEIGPLDYAVTFDYAGLGFTRADRFRYRYRLTGLDADWVDVGTQRRARYTNLAPGYYRFEVLVANQDGYWSEQRAGVELTATPPWHAQPAFRAGAVAAVIVLLAWAYRVRVRRLLALQRIRLGIAGDLHDELGSELAAIRVNSSLLESSPNLSGDERERLQSIGASAETVVHALRDIVWYVNPELDRLDALVERMRSHAHQVLSAHEVNFSISGADDHLPLPMTTRRHLYLIYKEALHNVVRHAEANRVAIDIALDHETLTIGIHDDGRGFIETTSDGTGLASMRRRAEVIGAGIEIESAPGDGTRLRVSLPVTRMRPGRRHRTRLA